MIGRTRRVLVVETVDPLEKTDEVAGPANRV